MILRDLVYYIKYIIKNNIAKTLFVFKMKNYFDRIIFIKIWINRVSCKSHIYIYADIDASQMRDRRPALINAVALS